MPKELTNLMDGVGPFAAGAANVIMQLSRLPIGRGVAESRVDSGRLDKHPIKRFRTTLMLIGLPIVLLLLFVYVFGGQLGAGLGAHQVADPDGARRFRIQGYPIHTHGRSRPLVARRIGEPGQDHRPGRLKPS